MKYDFFSDPGHGWLKVKRAELQRLGIEKAISRFSYQRGAFIYLEEDADLSRFVLTKQAHGESFEIREHISHRLSRIRDYAYYIP